jgi:hypothetical protein
VLRLALAFAAGAACAAAVLLWYFDPADARSAGAESRSTSTNTAPSVTRPPSAEAVRPDPHSADPRNADRDDTVSVTPADTYRVEVAPASGVHARWLEPRPDDVPNSQRDVHDRLEREPRDESWAHYAESLLQRFFKAPPFGESVDARVIECRATLCEVQAIAFALDRADYHRVLAELHVQPWFRTEFVSLGSTAGPASDGDQAFLIQLGRSGASATGHR